MTPPSGAGNTASAALARAVYDYLSARRELRSKRLLVHRYPREILERACKALLDLLDHDGNTHSILGRRVEIGMIQPPDEMGALASYHGWRYGCSPDWPVHARDRGGLLVVLCPPQWYESLHESIRSNSFLPFDEDGRPGSPLNVLQSMVEAADIGEDERGFVSAVGREVLARAGRRRHDDGIVRALGEVEAFLAIDPTPTPLSLRRLGLVPDDALQPGMPEADVRRRVRANLDYQDRLSEEMAKVPSKYFQETFPTEAERTIGDELRAHVTRFDYDLKMNDLRWRAEWPEGLTLDKVTGGVAPKGDKNRPKATVRSLSPTTSAGRWEGVHVIEDNDVDLQWGLSAPDDVREREVSVFVDGVEIGGVEARLDTMGVRVPDLPPGRHTLEIRARAGEDLEVLGETGCDVFVARGEIVPFSVRGQTAVGESFEVRPERTFRLVWRRPTGATVARWTLTCLGESGSFDEIDLDAGEDHFDVDGGVSETTDFELAGSDATGRRVCAATLRAAPLGERDGKKGARSVGQALVALAGDLREKRGAWLEARSKALTISVEGESADYYWIRVLDGDRVVVEQRFQALGSPLLDSFEQRFLDEPARPWVVASPAQGGGPSVQRWECRPSEQAEVGDWQQALVASVPEVGAFLDRRVPLFEKLRAASRGRGAAVGAVSLAALEDDIMAYATAYRRALDALLTREKEWEAFHTLLPLIDTVVIVGNLWRHPFAVAGQDSEIVALAVGPTHPLRLLWLLQYELAVRQTIVGGDDRDFNPDSFEGLSGINYPPYLLDFDRRFYRNVGVSPNYGWALYAPESEAENDATFSPFLQHELRLRTAGENVSVSSEQIRNALTYYHDAFPFRDTVRFHYIGAGAGEKIVEALDRWPKPQGRATGGSRKVEEATAARAKFVVNLLDVYDKERPTGTGRAFDEYAARGEGEGEGNLLDRTLFSVRSVERALFEGPEPMIKGLERHHIVFGSDLFKTRGDTHIAEGHAYPLSAWGLRNLPTKAIEGGAEPRLFVSALVPPPPVDEGRGSTMEWIADELHRIVYCFQVVASVSGGTRPYRRDSGRMQVVELDRRAMGAINRMHQIAEWVYIVDAHIDVELFDRPGQGREHYILDYRPMIGATGGHDPRHNYVVTTTDDTQVAAVVERFLRKEYGAAFAGVGSDAVGAAARRLLTTLNRVSGRSILKVLGRSTDIKGVVGIALARTLYQRLGLLEPSRDGHTVRSVRLLIPIDDYFDVWWADQKALLGKDPGRHHADLLDAYIELNGDVAKVRLQVVEVKNLHGGYAQGGIDAPVRQVRATHATLETILFGPERSGRRDAPIKTGEFVQVLDFHLRRGLMQSLGGDAAALESARAFRIGVQSAAASGRLSIELGIPSGGGPSAGAILHFTTEPNMPRFALREPGSFDVLERDPSVRYLRFGKDDAVALLRGVGTMEEDDVRVALDASDASSQDDSATVAVSLPPPAPPPTPILLTDVPSRGSGPCGDARNATATGAGGTDTSAPDASVGPSSLHTLPADDDYIARATSSFDGFVGNDSAKLLVIPILVEGLKADPRRLSINLMLDGPPSTGKTEIARRMARALGLPFLSTSASALSSIDDLLDLMRRQAESEGARLRQIGREGGIPVLLFPSMCVFIDEAHQLRNQVQQALLTFLEPKDRKGRGPRTKYVADVSNVTFVFATTDFGRLDGALRTRFDRITLSPYMKEEVERMVEAAYPGWPRDVYARLVVAGRTIPRIALDRGRTLARHLATYPNQGPAEALNRLFGLWGLDDLGLDERDRALLRLLEREGPLGVAYLAAQSTSSEDDITDVIEPYLSSLGFVGRSAKGRAITEDGRRYLRERTRRQ